MLEDLDLVLLGQLLQDVGEPLVVERRDHGGAALERQLVDHVGGVGGPHLVERGDQVGGALASSRRVSPSTSRHSTTWVWPRRRKPLAGSWIATRLSTQSRLRACSMPTS